MPNAATAQMVATGDLPDVILTWHGLLPMFREVGILSDVTPLVKKYNVDLSMFADAYLEALKGYGEPEQLVAFPFDARRIQGQEHSLHIQEQAICSTCTMIKPMPF